MWEFDESMSVYRQSIANVLFKQDAVAKKEYRIRLNALIDAARYLLRQGLHFCGHDETEELAIKWNFLQLVKYTGEQNEIIRKVILNNGPKNNQMVSPVIQKDIVHSFAEEVVPVYIFSKSAPAWTCSLERFPLATSIQGKITQHGT